jgi:MFS family permease
LKHLLAVFSYRDFCLFWIGQTISSLGSVFQGLALPWLILQTFHGSVLDLTLVTLSLAIPQTLLTLIGGAATDYLDARTIMIWADGIRILTSGTIALLAATGMLQLWLLCSILIVHGMAAGNFGPAANSITPHLVAKEHLTSANSFSSLIVQLGSIIGVLPAGFLLLTIGPVPAFAFNACSYAVAVGMAFLMKPLKREPQKRNSPPWYDLRESLRYLQTFPWLVTMLIMDAFVAIAAIGTNSIGIPLLARNTHIGAEGLSIFFWCYSCGSILGMLLPSIIHFRRCRGLVCIVFQGIEAMMMAGIAFAPLPLASLCMITWNLLNGVLVIITMTLIHEHVAKNMLSRITAFWLLASTGVMPLSQIGSGLVANVAGPQVLFVFAGSIMMIGALLGACVPSLRRLN